MKKIMSIIMVLVLMVSISSLALADEPAEGDCNWHFDEGNPENDCSLYCNNSTFENISTAYSTFEECEECRLEFLDNQTSENETEDPETNETEDPDGNETEDPVDNETEKQMEIMNNSLGAEIRLLQLEKAITKNLLKGEMAVDVLKALEYNTTDLEAILAEMRLVLEEVQAADPQANDSVEVFVGLKSDAKNLTKQFREAIKGLLDGVKYKEIKEQIRNITSGDLQNYSKQIRNRIKQFNRNQIYRLYGIIGEGNNSLVNEYMNGTCNLTQVKLQLSKMVNMKMKEKRNEIFSTLKKEKIQNKNNANSQASNVTSSFAQKEQERLQKRLEQANNSGNEKLIERIQNQITNNENSSNGSKNGGNSANANGKGKGK